KSQRGRSGMVSNITYDTLSVSNVDMAISINEYYSNNAIGALFLGSNINFHFEDNVTLLASPIKNSTTYPFIYTRYTGTMTMTLSSLLNCGIFTNINYNSSILGDQLYMFFFLFYFFCWLTK